MSTPFYDLASLVVVPSGYKASKVYAQKPLTTDGQLTFSRASTATRVNASGLIETVASNVPRLDYLGSTCPKILLEGQRTNIALYSEQFDNAAWTKTNATVSPNVAISPDGYTNADKLVEDTTFANHRVFQSVAATASTTYTSSVFVKKEEITAVSIIETTLGGCTFDLDNGTITGTGGFIESYGNGWFRCGITRTTAVGQISFVTQIRLSKGGTTAYTGNGVDGLYLWGAQTELGSYQSSYVPSLGAAVTRGADACSKTGISSLIGQTEGVLFVDFVPNNTPATVSQWLMFLGTGGNYIAIYISNQKLLSNVAATTDQCAIFTSYNLVAGTRYKAALAYKENDFAFYVNGVQIGVDTSGTVPAVSSLQNNYNTTAANSSNAGLNQALLFKTRLTNAQLAELTTL